MITALLNTSVYVLDLETALAFYVCKLGFRVHTDIVIDDDTRWASVCLPSDPTQQLMLIPVEEGKIFNHADASVMRNLIKNEVFSYGVFRCRNLLETFYQLKDNGVRFLMEPGNGFLGQYEASFIDDSGNWFRLTEDSDAV
jgi:catechol 2,3-dioxygenase-like lactoylglutathione lyase family enzyme